MAKKPSKLKTYREKRDFSRTPEPAGEVSASPSGRLFLIQKHAAGRLHYDLRLELDGVLKSWAVPKGPSLDPEQKRLAVQVEDHPLDYGSFEGIIPKGEYGGGTVLMWDRGEWEPRGDPEQGLRKGHLSFHLRGKKLQGIWALARIGGQEDNGEKNWLLIKKHDDQARPESEFDVTDLDLSVLSGRSMEQIAEAGDLVWQDGAAVPTNPNSSTPTTLAIKLDAASLPGARPTEMPKTFRPQLAMNVDKPPTGENWLHEIKYDGYRMLCFIDRGKVRFLTRRGQDWTEKFARVAAAAATLPVEQAILDGEMVVLEPGGTTDFQALQNLLHRREDKGLVFFVFDLPYLNGFDLTRVPLAERKKVLEGFIPTAEANAPLRYSEHLIGQGERFFQHACRFALEGIVSKQAGSIYQQKRSNRWRKVKCLNRQEFVVAGFTRPGGEREGFGALVLGYFDETGKLVHAGRVGTGFSEELLRDLHQTLVGLKTPESPFAESLPASEARDVTWVRPEMVVEVEFTSWTRDGRLRHPSFKGVREDKEASEIRREEAVNKINPEDEEEESPAETKVGAQVRRADTAEVAGVRLSNPERILYPGQGVTKRALAEFYQQVSDLMLPHLAGRPLTLFRCPRGRDEDCFFQKHFADAQPEFTRAVPIQEKEEMRNYLVVDNLPGIISLVQLGVLEIHPWPSREDKLERPDRMVFDLDPAENVGWREVIEGALAVRELLGELGLESFVKTSGGKGLHVVVPLARRSSWEELKDFSRAVVEKLVRREPGKFVATMSKSKRLGKIFIDHFRNNRGATSIATYSTRARAGAPVSTPLFWDEFKAVPAADHFTLENLPRRLARLGADPWEGFFDLRQSLTRKMKDRLQ